MIVKTRISTIFSMGAICMLLLMASCKKDELPSKPEASPFSVSLESETSIPSEGGTANLSIKAGSNGWWIEISEESKSWCTVTRMYGSGDYTLPVVLKANTTGQSRTASVKVSSTFGIPPVTVSIKQN